MPGYWRLAELDEKLRCAACQELFSLPAVDGDREALAAIRLLPRPASRYRLHATRHWVRTLTLEPGAPHLSLRR
jgi:hypothetical protein